MVSIAAAAVLLIAIAVIGAYALSGGFDSWGPNDPDEGSSDAPDDAPRNPTPEDPSGGDDGGGMNLPNLPWDNNDGGSDSNDPGVTPNPPAGGSDDGTDGGGGSDDGSGTGDGDGSGQPGNVVKLSAMNHPTDAVVGSSGHFDIMVHTLDNNAYTGDLVLRVDVTPSGQATAPAPGANAGLYGFDVTFDQPGDYRVKVTPADSSGNVIGDPIETTVRAVTAEGAIESTAHGAEKTGDHTVFWMTVRVKQSDTTGQPTAAVTKVVLDIDGGTYEDTDLVYPRDGASMAGIELPNSAYTPGAPYALTAYGANGQDMVTVSGNAPA